MNEYECLRKKNYVGFANVYLAGCNKRSHPNDVIDKELYSKLVKLDTRLGTTATEQLFWCVSYTLSLDIIKVRFQLKIKEIYIILVDKYETS